jgi:hypothetical protein
MTFARLRSKWLRGVVLPLVLGGFMPLATAGCIGGFELTHKVYQFNREVDSNKWIQWLAFLVLNVVPVYGFAVMIDAIFANSVEFWTGENPVNAATNGPDGATKVVQGPGGEIVRMTRLAPGVVDVDLTTPDGAETEVTVVLERDTIAAYDRDGLLLARVGDRNGVPALLAGAVASR